VQETEERGYFLKRASYFPESSDGGGSRVKRAFEKERNYGDGFLLLFEGGVRDRGKSEEKKPGVWL